MWAWIICIQKIVDSPSSLPLLLLVIFSTEPYQPLMLYHAIVNDVRWLCHIKRDKKKSFVVSAIQTEDTVVHLHPSGSLPDRHRSSAIISDKTKIKTPVSSEHLNRGSWLPKFPRKDKKNHLPQAAINNTELNGRIKIAFHFDEHAIRKTKSNERWEKIIPLNGGIRCYCLFSVS